MWKFVFRVNKFQQSTENSLAKIAPDVNGFHVYNVLNTGINETNFVFLGPEQCSYFKFNDSKEIIFSTTG